ncbi:MAG: hypothetical protein JNK67_08365 [Alphaproteobacteria bacterium]|nr:hypothetical protein [Alphaproteobacteria bacterium]
MLRTTKSLIGRWTGTPGTGARSRRASVAIIAAFALIPLLIGAGLAIDYVRLASVRGELQRAVDAAALAGARVVVSYPPNDEAVERDARRYFWANFQSGRSAATVGASDPAVAISAPDRASVTVSARANIPVLLVGVFAALLPGSGTGVSDFVISASATAMKSQRTMEMVLALDTTNSMAIGSRLANLKSGANDLLDIVYGATANERGTLECPGGAGDPRCRMNHSLVVGIVPFVATVNVGPSRGRPGGVPPIVDPALIRAVPWGGPGPGNSWKGCVMARPAPFEEARADATPAESPFAPYFWAPSSATVRWAGVTYAGPNPWSPATTAETWPDWPVPGARDNRELVGWGSGNHAAGPNRGCGYPILPLQPYKDVAKQHIAGLQVGATNGTTSTLGFSWAWRLLSPQWRPWWEDVPGYAYGATSRLATSTPRGMPRDYDALAEKVIVLFTDGQNEMGDGTPDSVQSCCTSAYGDWSTRPLGSDPVRELNRRTVEVCSAIKEKGVKIFVILLYASPPTSILETFNERGCASGPGYFFLTPDGRDLRAIFREVGAHLTNLRLVH